MNIDRVRSAGPLSLQGPLLPKGIPLAHQRWLEKLAHDTTSRHHSGRLGAVEIKLGDDCEIQHGTEWAKACQLGVSDENIEGAAPFIGLIPLSPRRRSL